MKIRDIWKGTAVKVWLIVSVLILTIVITASIIGTQTPFLKGTVDSVMGGPKRVLVSGNPEDYIRYEADYTSKADTLRAANLLNEQILEEGIILLKNEDNLLPLNGVEKITVFGKNSTNLVLGGSGSSAGTGSTTSIDLYKSLSNAGFEYNPVAKDFFSSSKSGSGRPAVPGMGTILTGYPIGETPKTLYQNNTALKNSYKDFNDLAIVVITRMGGEGYDLPRTMFWDGSKYSNWSGTELIPGARSKEDHYLQIDQNETDLLKEANDNFQNVVVLINSPSTIETGFLVDPTHYAYQPNVKGALWIGTPGATGANAIGKILKGEINPSGRTSDTYAADFKKDPSWNNFGNNLENDGNRYSVDGNYETRGFTDGQAWYDENVIYPLGYGLSYTTFTQEIGNTSFIEDGTILADDEINIDVKVTNTGNIAGKEVVQVYYTAPYYDGGIEKAHVVLVGFGKTGTLQPGQSETLSIKFTVRDMASYDYNDANNNDFKGYEVEEGKYIIKLMNNSNTVIEEKVVDVPLGGYQYEKDEVTGTEIVNLFDDVSNHVDTYMSRRNWEGTWPTRPTVEDRAVDSDFIGLLNYQLNDSPTDPWYQSQMPTQSDVVNSFNDTTIKLYDLVDKSYDDSMWDDLLDQLTITQMVTLVSRGNFKTMNIDNIGKPLTTDPDGPSGFANFMGDPSVYDTAYYASGVVLGATWSEELAYKFGKMIGNEGLIGNERGDGMPYSGWYAPAANIHRSQFGGRNFEYYSEDGLLSGKLAANIIKGAKEKGVYTYIKHFALNDQETNRDNTGLITWANEQAMRELYFRPFELAVKEGKTNAMMSAFNRIGTTWAGGSYPLLTALLRDEWGFRGMVITDFNLKTYMNTDQMVRAGGDISLSPSKNFSDTTSPTSVSALRQATKNILYTVANSNAMNGYGEGLVYKYTMPTWIILVIVINVGLVVIFAIWGVYVIRKQYKKMQKELIKPMRS
jgi:beta-glucosidase